MQDTENTQKTVKFVGSIEREVFSNGDNFWVYGMVVSKDDYPDIKQNKYNNVTINGNTGELSLAGIYTVTAIETKDKYGYSYNVVNIKRNTPKTADEMLLFLQEILTANQAKVLYENYPDIVERVKENRLSDIDLSKLKGIKEYTLNVIVQKIQENFCLYDLVVEFQGYLTLNICKKIYAKYNSIESLKTALRKDPYKCLCGLAGIGFKKADAMLLEIEKISKDNISKGKMPIILFDEPLISSKQRCLSCIMYILSENETNGHTKMNLAELRKQCLLVVPECINSFPDAIASPNISYNKEKMEIALTTTKGIEYFIASKIFDSIQCDEKNPAWEFELEKYRNVGGFDLTDEQFSILELICKNRVCILNGSAGVGKTASTQAIIKMLESNGKSYYLFSPTGKAAKVLSEYTNRRASTIHRGLGYQPPHEWLYNQDNPLDVDIVIVDEFSMVDAWLFSKLLCAIDFKKTRLLFIGDNAQLPSVQCGNLLHDFMFSGIIPTVTLTKVFRYGEGGLMKIATDVRMSKPYLDNSFKGKATSFGNGDYMFIDTPAEKVPQNVLKLYKKLIDKGYSIQDIQVLTAKNVGACGTMVMNKYLQKVANPKSQITTGLTYGKGDTAITYYVGDIVIQTQNNYKAEVVDKDFDWDISYNDLTGKPETAFVANGETGIVKEVTGTHLIIDFGGVCVQYSKAELNQINLGYSITIHKSQGSSIKIVILCTPSSDTFMLNSNLIYVGLTRMKEKCFHFGSVQCVNQAVKTKANLTRHTFMSDFLKEFSDKNNQTDTQVNTENS